MFFDFEKMGGTTTGKAAQSKGLGRLWEMCMDNTVRLLLSNLICLISMIPGALAMLYAVGKNSASLLLLAGILGGAIFGPQYGAMIDGILLALRGSSGEWWARYRMVWKRDWRGNLLPGVLVGILLALTVYVGLTVQFADALPITLLVCMVISVVIAVGIFTYLWPQRVFLDLKLYQIIKNSLYMMIAHPFVTLGSVAVQVAYWAIVVVLAPRSLIVLLVLGLWFPALAGTQIVYGKLNADFKMEERLGIVPLEEEDGEALNEED